MTESTGPLEARRLDLLRRSGLADWPAIPELEEICRRAKAHFGVGAALVTVVDAERQVVKAAAGSALAETPRSAAFCDWTIRGDDVLVVTDARSDPRFSTNPLVTGAPFIRFYAGAPLIYLDGCRIGSLCLLDPEPRVFSPVERVDLALAAEQVVGALIETEYERKFSRPPA